MNKELSMLWTVRGTDETTEQDVSIVIEAVTAAEAQYLAQRKGFPVVIVEPATDEDVRIARKAKCLHMWQPKGRYTCFGRPVGAMQLACLMLCGVFTALTVLHSSHVLGH